MTKPENDAVNAAEQSIAASTARSEPQIETATLIPSDSDAKDAPFDGRSAQQVALDEAKEIITVVAIALALVLVLRTLLFQPFTIPSASMEPNLYEGDYIIVSKWDYGISKYSFPIALPFIKDRVFNHMPKRGDVVVFKLPRDNKTDYIKRVIGLPGDHIQMKHDQLYINGQAVPATPLGTVAADDARFISGLDTANLLLENLPEGRTHLMQDMVKDGPVDDTDVYTVPAGHYFMMGDNRDNSEDSRFPMVTGGVDYVPAENLEGRAVLILMSWNKGASLWKPWTWLNFHWDRFAKSIR